MQFSQLQLELKCNRKFGIDTYFYSLKNARLLFSNIIPVQDQETKDQNLSVETRGLILKNASNEIILSSFSRENTIRSSYIEKTQSIWDKPDELQLSGISFFCGDRFTEGNMCHTTLDHLIRAWQCQESKITVDQFIFYESTWPWAKKIINNMLPNSKVIYIKELQCIRFEQLLFCANSFGGPGNTFAKSGMLGLSLKHPACLANRRFLKKLRRLTFKLTKKLDEIMPKKIFISRKSPARRFANQDELEKAIESYSYKVLYLEEISIQTQLKVFQSANIIIGLHGAGMTNIIGCKKRTKVVEIFGERGTSSYASIAESLDLEYIHLRIADQNNYSKADIEKLDYFLKNLENSSLV